MSATKSPSTRTSRPTKTVSESPRKRKARDKSRSSKDKKGGKDKKKRKKKKPAKKVYTAKTADKHELYQLSVQSPEEDVKFLTRVFKKVRGRIPLHFREDFCGTGLLASHWVKKSKEHTAEGFDICPDTVAWGMEHNFGPLGENASRMTFHVKDVREPSTRKPDIRCAQNFSYFIFKKRPELIGYLESVYKDLCADGAFVMDIYGGPDSMNEVIEERDIEEGFTYVWDQKHYWPATGDYLAYIHFEFKDGTKLKRAFTYDWRLWTLMELKDALEEVGFKQIDSYWEGTDEDGESGNGIYRKSKKGENCEAWVTYLVAYK